MILLLHTFKSNKFTNQRRSKFVALKSSISNIQLKEKLSSPDKMFTFENLALGSSAISSSSFDKTSRFSALTDGNTNGFFEKRKTIFATRPENDPWIHIHFRNKTGTVAYVIRIYLAESECAVSLSSKKENVRKCIEMKEYLTPLINNKQLFKLELYSSDLKLCHRWQFRSPRKVIVWQVPKNLLNSTVSSVKISLVRSERIPTSITLAEVEVFAKVRMKSLSNKSSSNFARNHFYSRTLDANKRKLVDRNNIEGCSENVLYRRRYLPMETKIEELYQLQQIRSKIEMVQQNCKKMLIESILPGPMGKGAGFGSTIFWRTGSFSEGFLQGRASAFEGNFNYAENDYCLSKNEYGNFECYFLPQSSCYIKNQRKRKKVLSIRRNLLPRKYRDGPPQDKRFDLMPTKLVQNNIFAWRSEQIRWLLRLNERTELLVNLQDQMRKFGFEKGKMIGLHIRHGDGCSHGRRKQHGCKNLSEFIEEARTMRDMYGQDVRKIYLATDSEDIIDQSVQFEPEFTFLHQNISRRKFKSGNKIEDRFNKLELQRHEIMIETLKDIFLLSECDYFITQQASALSRIALNLATSRLRRIPPYISLDGPWCYHWRMCCDVQRNGKQTTC